MAHCDSIVRGLPPQVLTLNCTEEMKVKVAQFMKAFEENGSGKISPSKALKKLNHAKESGCPLLDDCMKCPHVRDCKAIESAKEKE